MKTVLYSYITIVTIVGSCPSVQAAPAQTPFVTSPNKLHGRFLHITDIHPDSYYIPGGSISAICHDPNAKKKRDRAGYWGSASSDCDTPLSLFNLTLQWLEDEWADKIDFVLWTGDNARHDNDRSRPRTPAEIYESNTVVSDRMEDVFLSRGVPVVPSIGNNDIWPHNIMYPGPNSIINQYSAIWRPFLPFSSYQVFQRGAYFSVDLVPNQLGAISLNTLYFYDSNKAVDGCRLGTQDPGVLELDWLEVQLSLFRDRGMQVWIIGHVPPSPGNYFPDCYSRYGETVLRYQDTIAGQVFGHMNLDHFFWIDKEDLHLISTTDSDDLKKEMLHDALLSDFRYLPKKSKIDFDAYTIVNVNPSIIPTYLPGIRIYGYNVTFEAGSRYVGEAKRWEIEDDEDEWGDADYVESEESFKRKHGHRHGEPPPDGIDCRLLKNQNKKPCRLKQPSYASPLSPSRSNRLWTPLGYSQFYLPTIRTANETNPPTFELEYMTYNITAIDTSKDYPIPSRLLPPELRGGAETNLSEERLFARNKFAPYSLEDLTIPSWIKLGRKLGKGRKNNKKVSKLFKTFARYMYLGEIDV